jgi:hypothetical protein
VLRPAIVSAVLDGVFEAMAPGAVAPTIERARAELAIVEREIARFVEALALGGDMAAVIAALKARQTRQAELQRTRWGRGRASARRSEGRRAAGTRSVGWLAGAPDVGSRRGWPATVSRNSSRADPVHPGKGRETDVPIRGRNRVRSAVLGDCGPCTLYGVPNAGCAGVDSTGAGRSAGVVWHRESRLRWRRMRGMDAAPHRVWRYAVLAWAAPRRGLPPHRSPNLESQRESRFSGIAARCFHRSSIARFRFPLQAERPRDARHKFQPGRASTCLSLAL